MSAASSAHSVEVEPCHHSTSKHLAVPGTDAQPFDEYDTRRGATPRQCITRHYTSLEDHADAVHSATLTPGGGYVSSPRVVDRREGFAWELGHVEEPRHITPYPHPPPTPRTPPTFEELSKTDSKAKTREDGWPNNLRTESLSRNSTNDISVPSSLTPSRTNTSRSSISEVVRGTIRHVPDLRMFQPVEGKGELNTKRFNAQLDFANPSHDAHKPLERTFDRVQRRTSMSGPPTKMALKERRQIALKEAMTLTLPIDLPELPPRSRMPVSEPSSRLVPSRRRSPKTPWNDDKPLDWHKQGPKTAPAMIIEDDEPILPTENIPETPSQTLQSDNSTLEKVSQGFSLGRIGRGTFKKVIKPSHEEHRYAPNPRSRPVLDDTTQSEQGLKDHWARFRSCRSRWASSNDLNTTSPSKRPQSPFALSRLLKLKRPDQLFQTPHAPTKRDKSHGRRKQSTAVPDLEAIDNMPVPPSFVPPGLKRVPTPPMFDASGEVKGKLADFFFDLQGVRTHKLPASPGGVWDSDALLMPQHTDLEQYGSASEDSALDPILDSPVQPPNYPLFPTITTPTGGTYSPVSPPHYLADVNWSHAGSDSMDPKDPATRGAEEIAKLEWLIPEHLPTSPLCPLHAKYKGPRRGLCVFHSKRKSSPEAWPRRQSGQTGRKESRVQGRESGTASRRESSTLDGSEDAAEAGDQAPTDYRRRRGARRFWARLP